MNLFKSIASLGGYSNSSLGGLPFEVVNEVKSSSGGKEKAQPLQSSKSEHDSKFSQLSELFYDSYENSPFKILPGKPKNQNNSSYVSIFKSSKPNPPSKELSPVLQNIYKRVKTLRHPNILRLFDATELTGKGQIILITESVIPLQAYLNKLRQIYGNNSSFEESWIRWGIKSIISAIDFLGNDCNLIHGALSLNSIYVTRGGDWKLGNFTLISEFTSNGPSNYFIANDHIIESSFKSPERLNREWKTVGGSSAWTMDIFSFGIVIETIYSNCPSSYRTELQRMKADIPNHRSNPKQILESTYFQTEYIELMEFMDQIAVKPSNEKAAYYQKLPQKLFLFTSDCCIYKILPLLKHELTMGGNLNESLKLDPLASQILPSVFKIGENMRAAELEEMLLPLITILYSSNDRGVRVQLLQTVDQYVKYFDEKVINNTIFTNMCSGFSDTAPILRELTLKSMFPFVDKLNSVNLNIKLIKYLSKLQIDPEPAIRTNAIIFYGRIVSFLDDETRKKTLFPSLAKALRDSFPHARLAALKSTQACNDYFSSSDITQSIMPIICPLLIDPNMYVREQVFQLMTSYLSQMALVSDDMKIEEERKVKEIEEKSAKDQVDRDAKAAEAVQERNTNKELPSKSDETKIEKNVTISSISKSSSSGLNLKEVEDDFSDGWGDDNFLGTHSPIIAREQKNETTMFVGNSIGGVTKPFVTSDNFFDEWDKPKQSKLIISNDTMKSTKGIESTKKVQEEKKTLRAQKIIRKKSADWDDWNI